MSDEIATIDNETRMAKTWGVIVGAQHYRADVLVLPFGNQEPADWMTFTFASAGDDSLSVENFMAGAQPWVARLACQLVSAELHKIDRETYTALAASHSPTVAPEELASPEPLNAQDFAGPNRAQRRAQRPKRRRR